jgi:transposase
MPGVLLLLCAHLRSRFGRCTGIAFVDSTPVAVCHNRRITRHRVFKDLAARGKSTMGWFYGFKLHLIVNEQGELLAVHLTPGNVDDRRPLEGMSKDLLGKLFGDKGYLSHALFKTLYERGLELITSLRKNMKGQLMRLSDRLLLRKRFIIETITDQLKNISQIEHTRHRSPANFAVNLLAGLIAYTHQDKKPSLRLPTNLAQLPALI